jgi:DNA repair exonuclease SbcCD ATPase subunit
VTTLFLQRIEISNFRAYRDNFSLSLPGPGVTILTDPHGLGKSSFFEAIEWALTGRVRRLEALTQEDLDRGRSNVPLARTEEDVPVAQYRVALEFVNGEGEVSRIERRAVREQENGERFAEVSFPTQQQVIDLLRADSWLHEISDIGEYLRLTHLRGPAGTDKIDLAARRSGPGATRVSAEVITEKAIALAAALKAILEVEVPLERALPPAGMLAHLAQAMERAAAVLMERRRVLSQAEETLDAWQQLNSALAEARARHAASHAELVDLEGQLRAALEVDEQRRSAESKRDTLLRLSDARKKIAEGKTHKASITSRIDRYTHELWMVQTYLRDAKKAIQQAEAAQSAGDEPPDLESLNDHRARLMARIDELSLTIKSEHEVVAQVEQELLAAHALQQQYPELLSALGTLPSDEANAIDEAGRAVEQLAHRERQLLQSKEPIPSALASLNEEITQAQAALAQEASEAQSIERQIASLRQRWLELGLREFPEPLALYEQRNALAEQESRLQELREQQKRLVDGWLAWQDEEKLPQVESEISEQARRESPPSVDAVALLLGMSTADQWSRWPALLLDDPLQPHDLIHTAALIEGLRNLAHVRNYQVILSTHDEELAADIGRKLEEAGIKCVICRFRSQGSTGALHSTS